MIRRIHSNALVAGSVLVLVTLFGAGVFAQAGAERRQRPFAHGGPGRGGFPGIARLGLTDAQREQVRDVMQRHREEMRTAGQRLREAHDAQRAAVETVPVNEGLIRSTSQALATAQTDMALLRARIHNDVWSLLTPEQQEKARQLRADRENRMKQRPRGKP